MKKTAAILALIILCSCLCACGSAEEPSTSSVPLAPITTEEVAASESDALQAVREAPASESDAASDALYEQAQEYIGRPAEELFAAIGEPESSQYASSCEVDGGEDGMQFYDGFYVWTLRTDEEELVRAVYLDD